MAWIVLIVLAVVLVDTIFRVSVVLMVTPMFEKNPGFGVVPAPPDPDGREISFPTSHGLTLKGSVYTPSESRGVVVFCPEFSGNHWMAMRYARGLYEAGYTVVAFDFRGQGDSDPMPDYEPLHWLTEYEVDDVLAALDYVRGNPEFENQPLGLYGISRGGCAALVAASRVPEVHCVAADSTPPFGLMLEHFARRWAQLYVPKKVVQALPNWHVRASTAMVRMWSQVRRGCRYALIEHVTSRLRNKHVLIVSGKKDSYVKPKFVEILAKKIGPQCELFICPNAGHNTARMRNEEEYDRRLLACFGRLEASVPAQVT